MFKIFQKKQKEERLCEKYKKLMQRAYKAALYDKEKSDKLNSRARKILWELRRLDYREIDAWS
ncbi:Lacal_2735 family protein [Autumnicola musiva]|uniref:Lacal_2735 family protein n=1 Tax=Autumnicola musiva TaxID=3075589 RepID=A0ABU3DAZ8_9FLAO|nr:Lacal_2735 family protein [Zunongwangia sp. F117]MDT0678138.1 Lacal_2735 family protein [Zunongwangia sp. F117]